MLRVLLDTNVIVSATISPDGPSARILQVWRDGQIELATSLPLLEEFENVLSRPRIQKHQWMTADEIDALRTALRYAAFVGPGERLVTVIEDDPDDDWILSAALETEADCIVSGDPHLTDLDQYEGVDILMPAEFVERMESSE